VQAPELNLALVFFIISLISFCLQFSGLKMRKLREIDFLLNPSSPGRAIFLTVVCNFSNFISRQPIELESCFKHLRIQQSCSWYWKHIFFLFGVGVLCGCRHNGGMFSRILANFTWPWAPIKWAIFWSRFLESRLSFESLEPLIVFLAYLESKLLIKNQKLVKNFYPHKH